jgi:aryl-alcohol dehydrogenase-like predicted oxidoreductase
MQYLTIPGTDLNVSLLGFGNFVFGTNWWGDFTDADGIRLQNHAFDKGVNFFDTAPAYGNGRAEALMVDTIQYAGRDNLIISSKFGYDFYQDPGEEGGHRERKQDFSAKAIRFEVQQSLKRMKIDRIDLYQAHNLKLPQFNDELFDALEAIKAEGLIRQWGVALGPAIGWREEGYEALRRGAAVVQTVMNMYEQDPGREFCEVSEALGRGGVIARVPTNSGILDEEFKSASHKFPEHDHRKFRDRDWLVYGLKKNEIIRPLAKATGLSIRQFAFAWLASFATLSSIEPNILTEADIDEFAAASDAPALSADVLAKIADLYASDFDLGDAAHPCDWKSSVTESGTIRSGYQRPAMV